MKKIILCLALVCLTIAAPKWHQLENYQFEQYVKDFQKSYATGSEEYEARKIIFDVKLKAIKAHNLNSQMTYKKGVNQWTDNSDVEIKARSFGLNKGMKHRAMALHNSKKQFLAAKPEVITPEELAKLPKEVDWRKKGVTTPVKDQGHCGSCWAFSTVSIVESHAAIATGKLKTLSTEQLVACMPNELQCGGQGGCNGSDQELGFNYIAFMGLTSEFKYPYTSYYGNTDSCQFNHTKQTPEVTLDGYLRLPLNSYPHLLKAVATIGPITVSVDASNWHDYEEGVFNGCDITKNIDINHAVTLEGYGTDKNGDYWLIKNSWGTRFGENGYIRLKRDSNPLCGTDSTPLDGGACIGQTEPQTVCGQCGVLSDSSYPFNVQVIG